MVDVDDIINDSKPKIKRPVKKNKINRSKPVENKKTADPQVAESKEKQEEVKKPEEKAKEVTPIPLIKNDVSQKDGGKRLYNPSAANKTVQGSVGHDLLFKVKFDENGVSEVVHENKVVEKLLKVECVLYTGQDKKVKS